MQTINYRSKSHWQTIVIGGGQSGLATGYHLTRSKEDFLILDSNKQTGDSWRGRWDSLRLFTPAWTNDLPGFSFPGSRKAFPTKDEVAAFLEGYKKKFDLPVIYDAEVVSLSKTGDGYEIETKEKIFSAGNVVIATGNYTLPKIPSFAKNLHKDICQLHSSVYKSAAALPEGKVLVVGAATSGLQIAMDLLQAKRNVIVSGNPPFKVPDFIYKYFSKQFIWFATNILNSSTPMGRKAKKTMLSKHSPAPLINISLEDVLKAGASQVPKLAGSVDGLPVSETGEKIEADNIIWATGFAPDYSWLKLPGAMDLNGYPVGSRGISPVYKGLYFVGSLFQYGLTSSWLNGVGRDAAYVATDIHKAKRQTV